jgi:hypothetical protein
LKSQGQLGNILSVNARESLIFIQIRLIRFTRPSLAKRTFVLYKQQLSGQVTTGISLSYWPLGCAYRLLTLPL